jgi:hypothetical protein
MLLDREITAQQIVIKMAANGSENLRRDKTGEELIKVYF